MAVLSMEVLLKNGSDLTAEIEERMFNCVVESEKKAYRKEGLYQGLPYSVSSLMLMEQLGL